MAFIISDPQVTVNDELWPIKANSMVVTKGFGETSVMGLSTGGGGSEISVSKNVETKFSKLKFEVPSNIDSIKRVTSAKRRGTNNVVVVAAQDANGTQITFTQTLATITNDPDMSLMQDGTITLEWSGAPIP